MVRLSYKQLQQIAQSKPVRAKLRAKAQPIATRAQRLAEAEGLKVDISVTDGTRPKGRPYARVEMTPGGAEHGNARTTRRRILGRSLR